MNFRTQALFRWKGKSSLNSDENSCWLGYGDILVMGGQCQDEFLHCTDEGSEQERINETVPLDPTTCFILFFLENRCSVLSANVCAGFLCSCCGVGEERRLLGREGVLLQGVLALVYPFMCAGLGLRRCASRWTRPLGGGRWRHFHRDPHGVHWLARKFAPYSLGDGSDSYDEMPYMLTSAEQPSPHGHYACMECWADGALRGNKRHKKNETFFSPVKVFLSSDFWCTVWGLVLQHLWIDKTRNPAVEVFNVGAWLTHGDWPWRLTLIFWLLLNVVLFLLGCVVSGPGFFAGVWLRFGHLPARIHPMLATLELGWQA